MHLTERDVRVVRDLALSHVLSRDQLLQLGYFGSVTRANTRLRGLCALGLVRALDTPFFTQRLYAALPKASGVVGERLAALTAARTGSPRFLQHALAVTNIRVALLKRGTGEWRFEQQGRCTFSTGGRTWEVRPDGLFLTPSSLVAVEADLGHVAPRKFLEKLRAYDAFARSEACPQSWGRPSFSLLVVTTGPRRAAHLARLLSNSASFPVLCKTAAELDVSYPGTWS